MATKRRPLHSNFRAGGPELQRNDSRGTRPTSNPASVAEVLAMMLLHICKRIIFFDTHLKVYIYLGSLFLISLIGDFTPYPRTYFARSDNFLNVYFVKFGWAWTLALSVPFMVLTSRVMCCGDNNRIIKNHLPRICIATFFWFFWTKTFNWIEYSYGRCNVRGFDSKPSCLKGGHFWNGFDISGHAFILIYASLVLIEEARPIIGWEYIEEHLRNEEYNRATKTTSVTNPLRNLTNNQLKQLKLFYEKHTAHIRLLFLGMTVLHVLWDIMLLCTMLYYHKMIEKIISGIVAVATWFITYRIWYPTNETLPEAAGSGLFNYQKTKVSSIPLRKPSTKTSNASAAPRPDDVPKFMGMPLNIQTQSTCDWLKWKFINFV